jgi:CheY-like chemotaxis protein
VTSFERCVVLVADDEPTILQIVAIALRRHGYVVIPASDGPAAVRACHEQDGPIHLALLDIVMPGMSGLEVFDFLQRVHPKIEVLFMSGYQPEQIGALAAPLRDAHFIAKPFFPRDLVHRVNTILGNTDVCALLDDEQSATHA